METFDQYYNEKSPFEYDLPAVSVANPPNLRPKTRKQPEWNCFGPKEIVGLILGQMKIVDLNW